MPFTLKYSKNAAKDLQKLDNLVKRRIKEAVETKLVGNPVAASVKLRDFDVKGVRRFRVSNYRVIFVVNKKIIEVLRVGHRREIYK